MGHIAVIALALAVLATSRTVGPPPIDTSDIVQDPRLWLTPCTPLEAEDPCHLDYMSRVAKTLNIRGWLSPESGPPVVQLLVTPAFEPEWVVTIYKPQRGPCFVLATIAHENVWYANVAKSGNWCMRVRAARVRATSYKSDIDCPLAAEAERTWLQMLAHPRIPQEGDPFFTDGTTYTATSGSNRSCGKTHVPPAASPAAALAEAARALFEYARLRPTERAHERDEIIRILDRVVDMIETSSP